MEEIFGTIKTAQEKDGSLQTAEQKLEEIRKKNETELIEYLKEWFNSDDVRTKQFDRSPYSSSFLLDVKTFVEKNGYVFNCCVLTRPIFINGKREGIETCDAFIIACRLLDIDEFDYKKNLFL